MKTSGNILKLLKLGAIFGLLLFGGQLFISLGAACILVLMDISLKIRIILNIVLIVSMITEGLFVYLYILCDDLFKHVNVTINKEESV